MNEGNRQVDQAELVFQDIQAPALVEYMPTAPMMEIPLAEIGALGLAFQGIVEALQSAPVSAGEQLYRAIYPNGVVGTLANSSDGIGKLGAIFNNGKIVGQVRWVPVDSKVSVIPPVDPMTLVLATAFVQVSHQLSEIEAGQKAILSLLEEQRRARVCGSLDLLEEILRNLKTQWESEQYRSTMANQVAQIRREAYQELDQHRAHIERELQETKKFHSDRQVKKQLDQLMHDFEEFRLALYLFGFSTLVQVLLDGKVDHAYLDDLLRTLNGWSNTYRELYSQALTRLEDAQQSSLNTKLTSTAGKASRTVGGAIGKLPLVSRGPVDELLQRAGDQLAAQGEWQTDAVRQAFIQLRDPSVRPFLENLATLDRLYNSPLELRLSGDTLTLGSLELEKE